MEIKNMKNMIVLRNLPSNIIEEAFVVIKPSMKIKEVKLVENDKRYKEKSKTSNSKDYIVKEAEMLISNYISKVNEHKEKLNGHKIQIKYKKLRILTAILGFTSVLSIYINIVS